MKRQALRHRLSPKHDAAEERLRGLTRERLYEQQPPVREEEALTELGEEAGRAGHVVERVAADAGIVPSLALCTEAERASHDRGS